MVVFDRLKELILVIFNDLLNFKIAKSYFLIEEVAEILVVMRIFIACFYRR